MYSVQCTVYSVHRTLDKHWLVNESLNTFTIKLINKYIVKLLPMLI